MARKKKTEVTEVTDAPKDVPQTEQESVDQLIERELDPENQLVQSELDLNFFMGEPEVKEEVQQPEESRFEGKATAYGIEVHSDQLEGKGEPAPTIEHPYTLRQKQNESVAPFPEETEFVGRGYRSDLNLKSRIPNRTFYGDVPKSPDLFGPNPIRIKTFEELEAEDEAKRKEAEGRKAEGSRVNDPLSDNFLTCRNKSCAHRVNCLRYLMSRQRTSNQGIFYPETCREEGVFMDSEATNFTAYDTIDAIENNNRTKF